MTDPQCCAVFVEAATFRERQAKRQNLCDKGWEEDDVGHWFCKKCLQHICLSWCGYCEKCEFCYKGCEGFLKALRGDKTDSC